MDGEDEEGGQTAWLEQVGFELVIPEVSRLCNPKRLFPGMALCGGR